MVELSQKYSNVEEILVNVENGVLVIHQKGSGSFLMLKNLLISYLNEREMIYSESLDVFSINEFHPLYNDFNKTFGITNNSAVIVIVNNQIIEILNSPISKYKLLNSIQSIV